MTKEETKLILAIIAETYQRFEYTDTLVSIWSSIFANENAEAVKKAVLKIIEVDKFAPTPARVKELIEEEFLEKAKQGLTLEERDALQRDPAAVWAGAHKKMLTDREKYKKFLYSPIVPYWVKDAFEAVGGIELCTMGDDKHLYSKFERAWNEGKARFLGQMKNPQLNFHETPKIKAAGNLVKTF